MCISISSVTDLTRKLQASISKKRYNKHDPDNLNRSNETTVKTNTHRLCVFLDAEDCRNSDATPNRNPVELTGIASVLGKVHQANESKWIQIGPCNLSAMKGYYDGRIWMNLIQFDHALWYKIHQTDFILGSGHGTKIITSDSYSFRFVRMAPPWHNIRIEVDLVSSANGTLKTRYQSFSFGRTATWLEIWYQENHALEIFSTANWEIE
jgi:hypothetical protein